MGVESTKEGTYVYVWLIHCAEQQKVAQQTTLQ